MQYRCIGLIAYESTFHTHILTINQDLQHKDCKKLKRLTQETTDRYIFQHKANDQSPHVDQR